MKKYILRLFFLLTFVISWSMWVPAAVAKANGGTSILGPDNPVGQFARWALGIAAILLTGILAGKRGTGALFDPLKIWRVSVGWYLFQNE
jgi:hypothetical protein